MKTRPNNIWVNIFLSLAAIILFFAAMEIVLRLTVYNFKSYPVSPGPNSTYPIETAEFKTIVKINSQNMREAEIPPKTPTEFRILCLGDSFTFGLGVDIAETYPKVLECGLRKENPNVTVINGGTAGNARDAYQFLIEKGLGFKPDLVTVQIYIGNDFYDGINFLKKTTGDDARGRPMVHKESTCGPWGCASAGPVVFFKKFIQSLNIRTIEFLWTRLVQIPWIDDWLYQMNLRYDNRGIFLRQYPELEERLVKMELDSLEQIKTLCDEKKISVMFLIVPTKQQLFKKHFLDNEKYNYRRPDEIIRTFAESKEVPVLDFLDIFDRMPEKDLKAFYFVKDRHWTVAAHAFAAKTLEDFIKKNLGGLHQTLS